MPILKSGRALTAVEHSYFAPYFKPNTLYAARIIEGYVPFWLRKAMCAVVIGKRIYFRTGVYQANTIASTTLLAHELTHVEQYLSGMTIVKYLWASRHGYRRNPYEIEAYAKGAYVCQKLLENQHFKAT